MRTLSRINRRELFGIVSTVGFLAACSRPPARQRWPHQMGDNVRCGWFSFTVLEVEYKSQLGEGALAKRPRDLFIAIRVQATSAAGKPVSIPFLRLQTENENWIPEVEDGTGLDNWFGLFRTVEPGATETGWLLFDAPAGSYGLMLSDGAMDAEQTALVRIPLQVSTG